MSPLSKDQKKLRLTGIGSSEIAAVAGLSPYATPLDVWRSKVEGFELEETLPMKRGRILEPALAEWYAEETGSTLTEPGTIRHPTSAIALATPDRIATLGTERRVVELKTANFRMMDKWGDPGSDNVPAAYLVQVQWELACAGLAEADLAVLIAGDDFRIYRLRRDLELESMLLEKADAFWRDHVLTRTPPPVDSSDSCSRWLADKFPRSSGELLPASPEAAALAAQLFEARRVLSVAEATEKDARNKLQALIGSADGIAGFDWKITWRNVKGRATTNWQAVAEEIGAPAEIIQRHTNTAAGYRRFLPTPPKESK